MEKDVVVVMSTYNGAKNIVRQMDSIFKQREVDVTLLVRDDHSTDNTVDVIKQYKEITGNKIKIIEGENEGYAKSFWDALYSAPESSYYAFSDQDDVWNADKLIKSISAFEKDSEVPQLVYCKMTRTDPNLKQLEEQVKVLKPNELNKKVVLTQTFNYGAATVINHSAKQLVCKHFPIYTKAPHDAWVGLLCYWFGKVHYLNESLYSWVRYESSVTGAGTKRSGRIYRIKATLNGESYMNLSKDLLLAYSDYLSEKDEVFLKRIINYKNNLRDKISLLLDIGFRRDSMMGTLALKLGILTNRF